MKHLYKFTLALTLLFFVACDDNSSSASADEPENTSSSSEYADSSSGEQKDQSSSSVDKRSSSSEKKSTSSESSATSSSSGNPKSSASTKILTDPIAIFNPRVPQKDVYTCSMDDGYISMKQSFEQRDFICSFKYGGREGFIYAQASPTDCIQSMGLDPVYSTDTAIMYIGGKYTPITDLVYDVGGNHRNDNFRFTFEGKVYEYDHSSYGWGYRKCHTMDCLRVYEADGETEILDGCASFDEDLNNVRRLPIVCRFADEEGKFDDFTDTFEICEGDFRLQ
jgi:hypothetical protein